VLRRARVHLDEETTLDDAVAKILGGPTAKRLRGVIAGPLTVADIGDPCAGDLSDLSDDRTV